MAAKSERAKNKFKVAGAGLGILVLLGLPCLAGGLFLSWYSLSTITDYLAARTWPEWPARVIEVELERRRSDEGYKYSVDCTYEYEVHGRTYTGDRVAITNMSEGSSSWPRSAYNTLKSAQEAGETVPAYVNPNNPEDALLFRELRRGQLALMMLLAVTFSSIGISMCIYGAAGRRRVRRSQALVEQYPDEPWMYDPDWATGMAFQGWLDTRIRIAFAVAAYWLLMTWPMFVVMVPALSGPESLTAALGLLIPLAGFGVLAYAVYLWRRRRRWGSSYLELETLPGVIGGHFRGKLAVVGDVESLLDGVELQLRCTKQVRHGKSTSTEEVWEDKRAFKDMPVTFGQARYELPVKFQVPGDCPPSSGANDASTSWKLHVRGRAPGPDLRLDFEVPVFVTAETDRRIGKSAEVRAAEQAVVQADDSPAPEKIRVSHLDATRREIEVSCWPGLTMAGAVAVVCLIFLGASGFLLYLVLNGNWLPLVVLVFFLPFSLVLPLAFFGLTGKYTVMLAPGAVRVRRSWGPVHRERGIDVDQVRSIKHKQSGSSGSRKWYSVQAHLRGGKKVTLASMLPGLVAARWFVRQAQESLGQTDAGEGERSLPPEEAHWQHTAEE